MPTKTEREFSPPKAASIFFLASTDRCLFSRTPSAAVGRNERLARRAWRLESADLALRCTIARVGHSPLYSTLTWSQSCPSGPRRRRGLQAADGSRVCAENGGLQMPHCNQPILFRASQACLLLVPIERPYKCASDHATCRRACLSLAAPASWHAFGRVCSAWCGLI